MGGLEIVAALTKRLTEGIIIGEDLISFSWPIPFHIHSI